MDRDKLLNEISQEMTSIDKELAILDDRRKELRKRQAELIISWNEKSKLSNDVEYKGD